MKQNLGALLAGWWVVAGAMLLAGAMLPAGTPRIGQTSPGAGPVVVVETTRGTFEFETYPNEAPKTVAHILGLVERRFYDGQRVHRVVRGDLVQFGDPRTRDLSLRAQWGAGPEAGSGVPVGRAEVNSKRPHLRGAVGMAHPGDPAAADSQLYIVLRPRPDLNKNHTVVGQVIAGMDVVDALDELVVIQRAAVKP